MSAVFKICISNKFNDRMINLKFVEAIAGKGLLNDRYYKKDNDKISQITLIELENIKYLNNISNRNIPFINFRRNIITKGIRLNNLIDKKILIGKVELLIHDLCHPCLELQKKLRQKDLVKNLINKGGIRAEIIKGGTINIKDKISIIV